MEIKASIVALYKNKYFGSNLTHFSELLAEHENIKISKSTIRSILRKEFILSPKARRKTRKAMAKELKNLQKKAKTKKENFLIQSAILDAQEAHPRRPKSAYFGEMIQMDASEYLWFGNTKTQLHVAVDDATGGIVGAYFDTQETLNGYYHVLHQILIHHGIPYQFFTDNRTVFEYKLKKDADVEKDTSTQFGYACKQLGIDIKTSSVPQAKGRVERMNSTLPSDTIKSAFEMQPDMEKINLTLAVLSSRKIDNGSCLKYHNEYYLPVDSNGYPIHYRKGTTSMVIRAFDGELYSCIQEQVYVLERLPEHKPSSKAFDLAELPKEPKKKYIPPMSHPWKQASFERYMKKQGHRADVA